MKHIMFFCIPAHGHHNPTFPVVAELVKRGNEVRYFSFEEFREKIEKTGAEFIACDSFLPELSKEEETALKNVSVTEMTITDLKTVASMDSFLKEQVEEYKPDVIVSDSACFWGKLTAGKYGIPLVVSTTTFAFNKYSSKYMKSSFSEIMDLIKGNGRVKKELKKLEKYGYHVKGILSLVQSDNYTDTIVYATKKYQPCSETFSKHYAFVGPSVFSAIEPEKQRASRDAGNSCVQHRALRGASRPGVQPKRKPLVFISLGTVINERPDFYRNCIQALADENVEIIISCGRAVDAGQFENLSDHVKVYPYVDQLDILSKADVFLTHCGMNSASESLYMGTPMVLFPQTNEQRAVAKRAEEMGAGVLLKGDGAGDIRTAVRTVLGNREYSDRAMECSRDFREAPGQKGAAEFIETAPHLMPDEDKKEIRKEILPGILQLLFWVVAVPLIIFLPVKWWVSAIAANVVFIPYKKLTFHLAKK